MKAEGVRIARVPDAWREKAVDLRRGEERQRAQARRDDAEDGGGGAEQARVPGDSSEKGGVAVVDHAAERECRTGNEPRTLAVEGR